MGWSLGKGFINFLKIFGNEDQGLLSIRKISESHRSTRHWSRASGEYLGLTPAHRRDQETTLSKTQRRPLSACPLPVLGGSELEL